VIAREGGDFSAKIGRVVFRWCRARRTRALDGRKDNKRRLTWQLIRALSPPNNNTGDPLRVQLQEGQTALHYRPCCTSMVVAPHSVRTCQITLFSILLLRLDGATAPPPTRSILCPPRIPHRNPQKLRLTTRYVHTGASFCYITPEPNRRHNPLASLLFARPKMKNNAPPPGRRRRTVDEGIWRRAIAPRKSFDPTN
jgi:hypothetical protein